MRLKLPSFGFKVNSIMEKLEHVGIAVKDLAAANSVFARLFGSEHYKIESVASESVTTSFFRVGEVKIELLQATDANSAIARFIGKRGEGIHHLAFEVTDLEESIKKYEALGFEVINPQPKKGADNKLVAFLHPRSTNGVLIELCQEIKPKNQ